MPVSRLSSNVRHSLEYRLSFACLDKGLGKDNQGMKAALKPVLKFDSRGVSDMKMGLRFISILVVILGTLGWL